MKKNNSYLSPFSGKTHSVCAHLLKQRPKSPFSFATLQLHEDMDQDVTYIRRIPMNPLFWQGVICQVWANQLGEHWRHSQGVSLVNFGILMAFTPRGKTNFEKGKCYNLLLE